MSSRLASKRSFSVKGSPTWTWGRLSEPSSSSSEAKVAPWIPSRPVLAPTAMTALPTPSASPRIKSSSRSMPTHITLMIGLRS